MAFRIPTCKNLHLFPIIISTFFYKTAHHRVIEQGRIFGNQQKPTLHDMIFQPLHDHHFNISFFLFFFSLKLKFHLNERCLESVEEAKEHPSELYKQGIIVIVHFTEIYRALGPQ